VASGGEDDTEPGEARVWDAHNGSAASRVMMQNGAVYRACFSPDDRYVLTAGCLRTAQLWDAATGEPVSLPLEHPGDVLDAAFSPNGRHFVTGCADGSVRIWPLPDAVAPHADLVRIAQLLSNSRVDEAG